MLFTYWQEPDGMWLGYMNDYPDNWTQGHTLEELKRMLISLRHDIEGEPMPGVRHTGAPLGRRQRPSQAYAIDLKRTVDV